MRISDWSSDVCSSDLRAGALSSARGVRNGTSRAQCHARSPRLGACRWRPAGRKVPDPAGRHRDRRGEGLQRSEEHTSELQSVMRTSYAVFRVKRKTVCQPSPPKSYIEKGHISTTTNQD